MSNELVPIVAIPILLVLSFVFQATLNKKFDYECGNCGTRFSISSFTALLTPHGMTRKLLKCPSCGKWTWARRVRKGQ